MPNIKSAKKRVLVNAKKAEQNKIIRSTVRTEIKKVDALVKNNQLEEAKAALNNAFSIIDSACAKNIIHANNAANKKAKLAKKVSAMNFALSGSPGISTVFAICPTSALLCGVAIFYPSLYPQNYYYVSFNNYPLFYHKL